MEMWFSSRIQHIALPSNHDRKNSASVQVRGRSALLTDISKALDYFLPDLLIAKLAAYGFEYDCLVFTQCHLSEQQQRTKVNNACNTCSDILYGVPQVSILGLVLLNIYISDMFYDIDKCNIASCADDNTPYTSDFNLEEVIQKLELITNNLFKLKATLTSDACNCFVKTVNSFQPLTIFTKSLIVDICMVLNTPLSHKLSIY